MGYQDSHLADEQLLLDLEGQLSARDAKQVQAHLSGCWRCRTRRQELENSITGFVRAYQGQFDAKLPPIEGPRALLKAHLSQLAATEPGRQSEWFTLRRLSWAAALVALLGLGLFLDRSSSERKNAARIDSIPDSNLTPGATVFVNRRDVCAQESIKNKAVPVALQRKVFEEYGIPRADPRAYEVDYLVTPALGGADDIHNLWPEPYSATVWNARVKDALEDRLREMVCDENMDLQEAQREIAANWIAAYKKYFHTDQPLPEHYQQSVQ